MGNAPAILLEELEGLADLAGSPAHCCRTMSGEASRESSFDSEGSCRIDVPRKPVIIFDWDDTLMCSSEIRRASLAPDPKELRELEALVVQVLATSVSLGHTAIVTNANLCWVRATCSMFMPSVLPLLKAVDIMSARQSYEHLWPGDPSAWKRQAFRDLVFKDPADVAVASIPAIVPPQPTPPTPQDKTPPPSPSRKLSTVEICQELPGSVSEICSAGWPVLLGSIIPQLAAKPAVVEEKGAAFKAALSAALAAARKCSSDAGDLRVGGGAGNVVGVFDTTKHSGGNDKLSDASAAVCERAMHSKASVSARRGLNLVVLGDSTAEIQAGRNLVQSRLEHDSIVKTIKFKEAPTAAELRAQLAVVARELGALVEEERSTSKRLVQGRLTGWSLRDTNSTGSILVPWFPVS